MVCHNTFMRLSPVRATLVALPLAVVALFAVAREPKRENAFRFSILGDRTGGAMPGVYEQVWHELDRLKPDFVINTGDTIEGGNDASAPREWNALRAIWDRYPYPRFFTPGNHDIWSDASRRLYEEQTGRPPSYSFDFQDAHFTVLDNSSSPLLSAGQTRFLEDDLRRNRDRAPKFVFFHEPFWVVLVKLGSGEFPLHQLARKYGVNYVVGGHGHQLVHLERDGVHYVEVGSSGASISRGTSRGQGYEQGWFPQHVFVTVTGRTVAVSLRELGPPFGKGRITRLEEWDGNRLR